MQQAPWPHPVGSWSAYPYPPHLLVPGFSPALNQPITATVPQPLPPIPSDSAPTTAPLPMLPPPWLSLPPPPPDVLFPPYWPPPLAPPAFFQPPPPWLLPAGSFEGASATVPAATGATQQPRRLRPRERSTQSFLVLGETDRERARVGHVSELPPILVEILSSHRARVHELFATLDVNHDGEVEADEFQNVLTALGFVAPHEDDLYRLVRAPLTPLVLTRRAVRGTLPTVCVLTWSCRVRVLTVQFRAIDKPPTGRVTFDKLDAFCRAVKRGRQVITPEAEADRRARLGIDVAEAHAAERARLEVEAALWTATSATGKVDSRARAAAQRSSGIGRRRAEEAAGLFGALQHSSSEPVVSQREPGRGHARRPTRVTWGDAAAGGAEGGGEGGLLTDERAMHRRPEKYGSEFEASRGHEQEARARLVKAQRDLSRRASMNAVQGVRQRNRATATVMRTDLDQWLAKDISRRLESVAPASHAEMVALSSELHKLALGGRQEGEVPMWTCFSIFEAMDVKQNGHLSFQEFERTLRDTLGYHGDEGSLLALWRGLDRDASGFITKGEFAQFWRLSHGVAARERAEARTARRREQRQQKSERLVQKDHNYYHNRATVCERSASAMEQKAAALEHTVELTQLFQEIDVDQSGEVDADELLSALSAKGLLASAQQIEVMMNSGDTNNDGRLTLAEFLAAAAESEF